MWNEGPRKRKTFLPGDSYAAQILQETCPLHPAPWSNYYPLPRGIPELILGSVLEQQGIRWSVSCTSAQRAYGWDTWTILGQNVVGAGREHLGGERREDVLVGKSERLYRRDSHEGWVRFCVGKGERRGRISEGLQWAEVIEIATAQFTNSCFTHLAVFIPTMILQLGHYAHSTTKWGQWGAGEKVQPGSVILKAILSAPKYAPSTE